MGFARRFPTDTESIHVMTAAISTAAMTKDAALRAAAPVLILSPATIVSMSSVYAPEPMIHFHSLY
jgi:hypothetical protein